MKKLSLYSTCVYDLLTFARRTPEPRVSDQESSQITGSQDFAFLSFFSCLLSHARHPGRVKITGDTREATPKASVAYERGEINVCRLCRGEMRRDEARRWDTRQRVGSCSRHVAAKLHRQDEREKRRAGRKKKERRRTSIAPVAYPQKEPQRETRFRAFSRICLRPKDSSSFLLPRPWWPPARFFFVFFTSTQSPRPSYGRCRLLQRRSYNFSEKASIIVIVCKFMVDGVFAHGTTTCESSPSLELSLSLFSLLLLLCIVMYSRSDLIIIQKRNSRMRGWRLMTCADS